MARHGQVGLDEDPTRAVGLGAGGRGHLRAKDEAMTPAAHRTVRVGIASSGASLSAVGRTRTLLVVDVGHGHPGPDLDAEPLELASRPMRSAPAG